MKKFAWIIALLAALSLGFFACTEPDGTAYQPPRVAVVETELTTLFDMQNSANGTITHGIQELPVGALTFPASGAGPTAPLVKAGDMPGHISSFEVVEVGGKKALKYVTVANWGPGFDMPHSAFGFRAGDVITITGTAAGTSIDLALNVNQGAAQHIAGNRITSAGAFTITAELTAANIAEILTNEQVVIRFEDRAGGTTVTVTQVKVEGQRPSSITQLGAPTIALSGDTISWTAVPEANGYKVYAATELLTTTSAVSVNIYSVLGEKNKAAGTYSITVVTGGTVGSTSDSVASNAVSYVFEPYAVEMEFPRDITATVTHTNPRLVRYGAGNNFEVNAINKVTVQAANTGYMAYVYPTDVAGFNIAEWDFAELSFRVTGTPTNFVYKVYPDANKDTPAGARVGNLPVNTDDTITLEIRKIPQGLGLQKYSAGGGEVVIELSKVVYSKAQRYNIRLDADGGSVTPSTMYFVDGTKVADHLPVPTKAGQTFLGWKNTSTNNWATDDVTVSAGEFDNATFIAQWTPTVAVTPIVVDFTSDITVNAGTFSDGTATGNYKFVHVASYDSSEFFTFKVTLATGAVLVNYSTLDFTVAAGSATYKPVVLYAGESDFADDTTPVANAGAGGAIRVYDSGSANVLGGVPANLSLPIDKAKAIGLTGNVLYFSIYIQGGSGDTFNVTGVTLK
jgi:uncharacterized repeat protein (TIGR02543 family)